VRVRPDPVPQAREHAGPVVVVVMIAVVIVVVVVTVVMTVVMELLVIVTVVVTVLVAVVVVLVAGTVVVVVTVIQVRAVHGVHDIQNARINALPHIDKYQGRALANCPQYARVASPGLSRGQVSRNSRSESYRDGSKPGG
jgi:hypothetical protein